MKTRRARILWPILAALLLAAALLSLFGAPGVPEKAEAQSQGSRPNILFVMTDDQPKDTMLAMPNVRQRVGDQGVVMTDAYVTQSLCCPSRASTLRGQYPHNTGVEKNGPPNGGVETFNARNHDQNNVATRLTASGYTTGLVGKYMNGYNALYKPPGWSYWYGRADASTPGERVRENGTTTDLQGTPGNWGDRFSDAAHGFLERNTDQAGDGPFALFLWTAQPHLQAQDYAPRYDGLYNSNTLPKDAAFDEADVSDKPSWVRDLPRIGDAKTADLNQWHRNQLRSSRQVDDTVGRMLDLLRDRGELENTFVVFTTDNSTHMGEHRWYGFHGAKSTPYQEAASVPMYVRGPGIPGNTVRGDLVTNNDLAPTFLRIAGESAPAYTDGRSLLSTWRGIDPIGRTAILNERGYGDGNPIPPYHSVITKNQTYTEYGTGEREHYDRATDPLELRNAYDPQSPPAGLAARLDALKTCSGASCVAAEDGQ